MDILFLQHFFRNPKGVGALVPLSHHAAHALLLKFSQRADNRPWNILEVGAGTGNITQEIVQIMHPDDRLDVIEIDQECCQILKEKFGHEKNTHVECLSVLDWHPSYKYDIIVSTLPMNSFDPDTVKKILEHYQQISTKDALCSYVEYMGLEKLNYLFSKKTARDAIKARRKILEKFHHVHLLEKNKVFANFFPCYVYWMTLNEPVSA